MKTVNAVIGNNLDDCVTLVGSAVAGDTICFICDGAARSVIAREEIAAWHKVAIKTIDEGSFVHKYGAAIGVATKRIAEGSLVHIHNMRSPEIFDVQADSAVKDPEPSVSGAIVTEPSASGAAVTGSADQRHFFGYKRPDGKTGVRNHVVVMPGVICATVAARRIAAATGAVYLDNPFGCGQTVADTERTLHILSGLLANPNVYGALIVGLGCEFLSEERYRSAIESKSKGKPLGYVCIQKDGAIAGTVEKGERIVREMLEEATKCARVECDISELMLGLECGGSDPTSGLSANVVLGQVSDRLVDIGGTVVISETAEAIGAERALMDRGATPEIGRALYDCVRNKDAAYAELGENIRNSNPSPGNIKSGITTLEEKSLGCINKCGTRPFAALVGYGDIVDVRGVVFMDTTAYDAASVTAKIAGGCQVVAFTTGLGNPIGNAIAPVIKITGNSDTGSILSDMIDFVTGDTLIGCKTVAQSADELIELLLRVCSGEPVKAEINGSDVISIDHRHMLA